MAFHFGPQIIRIRKTAWFASILVLAFLGHSLWLMFTGDRISMVTVDSTDADTISFLVSAGWVDGKPFREDSTFKAVRDRVHAYSKATQHKDLAHVWFHEGDLVARIPCLHAERCETSIADDSLPVGRWSVDFVSGRELLASRQFRVIP